MEKPGPDAVEGGSRLVSFRPVIHRGHNDLTRDRRLQEGSLGADHIVADLCSATATMLDPMATNQIHEMADAVRHHAEPHVATRFPRLGVISHPRSSEQFPDIESLMKVELGFAYGILGDLSRSSEESRNFLEESQRLDFEVVDFFSGEDQAGRALPRTKMHREYRLGALNYMRAVWSGNDSDFKGLNVKGIEYAENALRHFQTLLDYILQMDALVRKFHETFAKMRENQEAMLAFLEIDFDDPANERGRGMRQICEQAFTGEHLFLMQDACLGLARTLALLGRKEEALKMLNLLDKVQAEEHEKRVSTLIQDWSNHLREEIKQSPCNFLCSQAPASVHEFALELDRKFGHRPPYVYS